MRGRLSISLVLPDGLRWSPGCLIKTEIFERSKHLTNDSFTIRCDVTITENIAVGEAVPSAAVVVPPPDIQKHIGSLLLSNEGADVTFQVGAETFVAHRCVLAARSAVFRAELFGPRKEGTTASVIQVHGMEPQVFKLLLGFIYTDSFPGIEGEEDECVLWQHLLVAADRYDLQRLRLMSEKKVMRAR
jgi:speckle-type POZ protein